MEPVSYTFVLRYHCVKDDLSVSHYTAPVLVFVVRQESSWRNSSSCVREREEVQKRVPLIKMWAHHTAAFLLPFLLSSLPLPGSVHHPPLLWKPTQNHPPTGPSPAQLRQAGEWVPTPAQLRQPGEWVPTPAQLRQPGELVPTPASTKAHKGLPCRSNPLSSIQ